MPVNRDLSDLPKASSVPAEGWAPDGTPRWGQVLLERWYADEAMRDNDRLARFRHSDAGACARAIAYAALKVHESNPIDIPGIFITRQGQEIHGAWQDALAAHYGPAAEIEAKVVATDEDGRRQRGGHIDAVVTTTNEDAMPEPAPWVTSIEAKTVGGFAYKRAIGIPPASRTPMGPSYSHIIQAALGALERQADEAVILYLSREAISIQAAQRAKIPELRRVIAEWTLDRETYTRVARKEIERIEGILALVDAGELPRRKIPDPELPPGHRIERPEEGGWVDYDRDGNVIDAGTTWHCTYCRWQSLCATHPTDRVSITEVGLG